MPSSVFTLNYPFILASGSPRRRELLSWLGFEFGVVLAESESGPRLGESPLDYALRAAAEKTCEVAQKAIGLSAPPVPENDMLTAAQTAGLAPEGKTGSGMGNPANWPVVLGADTIVVLEGKIYGKPRTHSEALKTLEKLAGRTHEVITACCLLIPPVNDPCGRETSGGMPGAMQSCDTNGREAAAPTSGLNAPARAALNVPPLPLPFMNESSWAGGYRMIRFAQSSRVSMWECPPAVLRAYADSEEPMDKAGAYAVQGRGGFLIRGIEGSWTSVVGLPVAELTQILLAQEVVCA